MRVLISPKIYAQIDHYVQNTDIEISGLGRVMKHADGTMEVTKVYLLDQENTSATTDISAEAVAKLMFESRADAELGDLNFWWHSHVEMGVFWSGTDMATIYEFGKNGYLLATVFNKKGEYRSAVYSAGNEFLPQVFADEIQTDIMYQLGADELQFLDSEIKTKARKKKFKNKRGKKSKYTNQVWPDSDWQTDEFLIANTAKKHVAKSVSEEDAAMELMSQYISPQEEFEWTTYYAELKGKDVINVGYAEVWAFYELWDGDLLAMQNHVFSQMAEKDELDDAL